ncbi:protein HIDE1-like isoform X2 [Physeter macrocephalus]|uniref:Protein HIDE1-like isoform X2 n=1 Tax=Physeter macrocephalus TaxID=9755 RepID=A0A9W2WD60_PHYMC|nr:protein HIDE1-like isoform X2 [Physeter catodon]
MPWTVLLFAAGSLAIPAPSIMLVPPHPSSQEDPIHISCMAPRDFPGANFTLYQGEEVVQLLQAPADQLEVIFNLSGGSREVPGGPFRCQYGVLGEHRQPQLSNLSEPMHVSFPGKALPSFLTAPASIFSPLRLCRCCSLHLEVITGRATSCDLPGLFHFSLFNPHSHPMQWVQPFSPFSR